MTEDVLNQVQEIEDLSEIIQIRRNKLFKLQSEGRDPFKTTKYARTAYSAEIKENFETMENTDVSVADA